MNALSPLLTRLKALAALPIHTVTWGLVVIFSVWIVLDMTYLKISSGLSQTTYDAMVRNRLIAAAPDPRLVIVDIDEASLARMSREFGRWPWPRDTLASVQDFIEKEGPAAIVWDIAFADADRLSPGGDAAFNESAKRSLHSHYSVVRLPHANDHLSQLTHTHLPSLWIKPASKEIKPATLALIAPVLPNVAASKLGYNNGYPDSDGVLRRYRYSEDLHDGSTIQSSPLSVAKSLSPRLAEVITQLPKVLDKHGADSGTLVVWRKHADAYPKISFADVFAKAEGAQPLSQIPSFAGKVVVIGSTAPSLHDIHPTPLAAFQPGVESLATALDNALNERFIAEVPRLVQVLMAIGLCAALAFWVRRFGIASLDGALVILPGALLGVSYFSLNVLPVFIDLQLAAGAALLFLAALRAWNNFRRNYWCDVPESMTQTAMPMAVMGLRSSSDQPIADTGLDHLMDLLERHASHCRVVGGDVTSTWPSKLRWTELACFAALYGPESQLNQLKPTLPSHLRANEGVVLPSGHTKTDIADAAVRVYSSLT